jgi:hypothetical protein
VEADEFDGEPNFFGPFGHEVGRRHWVEFVDLTHGEADHYDDGIDAIEAWMYGNDDEIEPEADENGEVRDEVPGQVLPNLLDYIWSPDTWALYLRMGYDPTNARHINDFRRYRSWMSLSPFMRYRDRMGNAVQPAVVEVRIAADVFGIQYCEVLELDIHGRPIVTREFRATVYGRWARHFRFYNRILNVVLPDGPMDYPPIHFFRGPNTQILFVNGRPCLAIL